MGAVGSKGPVQLTTIPTSWIGLTIQGTAVASQLRTLSNAESTRPEIVALFKAPVGRAGQIVPLLVLGYYGRNAYYSVSRSSQVLAERRTADILSFVIALAIYVYNQFVVRPTEQAIVKQGDTKNFPVSPRIWQNSVTRLRQLKWVHLVLVIVLAFLQKRALRFQ